MTAADSASRAAVSTGVFQMDAGHYWSSLAIVTVLGIGLALFRWRLFQALHGGAASH